VKAWWQRQKAETKLSLVILASWFIRPLTDFASAIGREYGWLDEDQIVPVLPMVAWIAALFAICKLIEAVGKEGAEHGRESKLDDLLREARRGTPGEDLSAILKAWEHRSTTSPPALCRSPTLRRSRSRYCCKPRILGRAASRCW
jgi:hypothetical protein